MSGELGHATVGTAMTQAEFEAVGLHVCNSQATGDLIYASSSTQLTRLAIGTGVLIVSGGIPAWSSTLPAVTLGGAMTVSGQAFNAGANYAQITTTGTVSLMLTATNDGDTCGRIYFQHISTSPAVDDSVAQIYAEGKDLATPQNAVGYGKIQIRIEDATAASADGYFQVDLAVASVLNIAFTVSSVGLGWFDVGVNVDQYYQVAGTQVVGARVVDARCDDAINSGDATTDGVIDSLRDAMITHGLIAAA